MKRAAIRYAEILEKGAWVTHQEQAEIAKLLRSLVMNDDAEDRAWDELEARLNRQKAIKQPEQEPMAVLKVWDEKEQKHVLMNYHLTPPNKPEQEPVAWKDKTYGNLHHQNFGNSIPLYTAPPSKPWVSLTDDDRIEIFNSMDGGIYGFLKTWGWLNFSKELEAKLKEKNT